MDVGARVERLRGELASERLDALVVTSLTNIRYLTGFTGTAGVLAVPAGPGPLVLVTDGRYGEQAREQIDGSSVVADVVVGNLAEQHRALAGAVAKGIDGGGRVGLEADHATWTEYEVLSRTVLEGAEAVATRDIVEKGRRVKDAGEVARIREAARIADAALEDVLTDLPRLVRRRERVREAEVALRLDTAMRRLGATASAFETIVAAGTSAAMPHHRPSPQTIRPGDAIIIDFGAVVDGYRSDMTRTVCVGEPNEPTVGKMIEVVTASQESGVDAVRPGRPVREVDAACRSVISEAGWGELFVHGTGHGVGLDIHEAPWVGASSEDVLDVATVVTVEPGIYLPGTGGVRIEDTVVVTPSGREILTNAPKNTVLS